MKLVNIHEAKARLSELVEDAARGTVILICKRNQPVAELRAIHARRTAPRPLGLAAGIDVPAAFFEPLPEEVIAAFEGSGATPDVTALPGGDARESSRVAERPSRSAFGRPSGSAPRRRRS